MNPNKLIFDYLDGEISREDDKALRELLKEDSELSREFKAMLDMNYEIEKSNDNFIYPEEFLDNFEENMISRIEKDNAVIKAKERRRKVFWSYSIAAVPVFFMLLLLSNYTITNLQTDLKKLSSGSLLDVKKSAIEEKSIETGKNTESIAAEKSPITKTSSQKNSINHKSVNLSKIHKSDKASIVPSVMSENSDKAVISTSAQNNELKTAEISEPKDNVKSEANKFENNFQEKNIASRQFENSKSIITENKNISNNFESLNFNKSSNTFSNVQNENKNNLNENFGNSNGLNQNFNSFSPTLSNNIELNSFFGKDIVSFGVGGTNQAITSFTQSIAAQMDDYGRIGIETGYMQFSGDVPMYTIIKKSQSDLQDGITIVENSDEKDVLIRTKGTEKSEKNLIWAGLFYERNLIDLNHFKISSRMSLGASDVGFVSSLKIIGKYQLFNSIDLTIGADTKLFNGTQEFFTSKNSLSSTISFIYGVRFAF